MNATAKIKILLTAMAIVASPDLLAGEAYPWVSVGGQVFGAEHGGGGYTPYGNFSFVNGKRQLIGISQTGRSTSLECLDVNSCIGTTSLAETALHFGFLTAANYVSLSLGPARVEETGKHCDQSEHRSRCITAGLSAAITAEVPLFAVGFEGILFADWNSLNPFGGIGICLRFGSPPRLNPPVRPRQARHDVMFPVSPAVGAPPPALLHASAAHSAGQILRGGPGAAVHVRPASGAALTPGIVPNAEVRLNSSLTNNEGVWWYVTVGSTTGWIMEHELDRGIE